MVPTKVERNRQIIHKATNKYKLIFSTMPCQTFRDGVDGNSVVGGFNEEGCNAVSVLFSAGGWCDR